MKHSKQIIRNNPSTKTKLNFGLITLGVSVLTGVYLIFSKNETSVVGGGGTNTAPNTQDDEEGMSIEERFRASLVKGLPPLDHKAIQNTPTEKGGVQSELFGFFGHFFTDKEINGGVEQVYYPYLDDVDDNPIPPVPKDDNWDIKSWVKQNKPTKFLIGYRMLTQKEIQAKKRAFALENPKAQFPSEKESNLIAMYNMATPLTKVALFDAYLKKEKDSKTFLPLTDEWKKKKNNKPNFKQDIDPATSANGFFATTPEQRAENALKIARASNKTGLKTATIVTMEDFKKLIPDVSKLLETKKAKMQEIANDTQQELKDLEKADPYAKQDKKLSEEGIIYALACLLACEGNNHTSGYNHYQRQREYVAILWSLVNRCSTGYASRVLNKICDIPEIRLHRAIGLAISYTDPMLWIDSHESAKKKDVAISLMPLVKAFFMGYFNEEVQGATHWFHADAGVYPPLYYFSQGTLTRDDKPIEPHKLRSADSGICFINNCFFTKVKD